MIRFSRPGMLTVIAATSVLLAVSGCSTGSTGAEGDEPVTVTFSSYNFGTQGAAGEGTQALLDRFSELHPEIIVEPQGVASADVLTSAKTAVAAGDPRDVVQVGYSKLAEAVQTLPVQPLDRLGGDEWADHIDGIIPGLLETGTFDGDVYSLPYTVSVPTVFYNADLFRAAGLDPDQAPATMEEIRTDAEAIVTAGSEGVYFGVVDSAKSDYITQSAVASAGGSIIDADGDVRVDSPESVDALEQLQDLTTDGLQPAVELEDAVAAFSSGRLGMLVVSTAVVGSLETASEGVFELRSGGFPSFGADAAPTHSGAGLVVLSGDTEKQAAAWEFVKFLTSAEGYTIITSEIGYLPLRPDIVDDPAYLADYFAENSILIPAMAQLDEVTPYRSFPGSRSNQATVMLQDDAVAPIVLRGADVADTLRSVADEIRDSVDDQ